MALIHHALYGGKAAGRDFRNHLCSCTEFLNFKSCLADPDVWMRPAIKSDGNTYYEYILLYMDDALVVSENAESILHNELGRYFHLKGESIGPPTIYLGGRIHKVQLEMVYGHGVLAHHNMYNLPSRMLRSMLESLRIHT